MSNGNNDNNKRDKKTVIPNLKEENNRDNTFLPDSDSQFAIEWSNASSSQVCPFDTVLITEKMRTEQPWRSIFENFYSSNRTKHRLIGGLFNATIVQKRLVWVFSKGVLSEMMKSDPNVQSRNSKLKATEYGGFFAEIETHSFAKIELESGANESGEKGHPGILIIICEPLVKYLESVTGKTRLELIEEQLDEAYEFIRRMEIPSEEALNYYEAELEKFFNGIGTKHTFMRSGSKECKGRRKFEKIVDSFFDEFGMTDATIKCIWEIIQSITEDQLRLDIAEDLVLRVLRLRGYKWPDDSNDA